MKLKLNKLTDFELSELVATRIMGWKEVSKDPKEARFLNPVGTPRFSVGYFASDITAAWDVVERMESLGWNFVFHGRVPGDEYWFIFQTVSINAAGFAPTAPRAICIAALSAMGV